MTMGHLREIQNRFTPQPRKGIQPNFPVFKMPVPDPSDNVGLAGRFHCQTERVGN